MDPLGVIVWFFDIVIKVFIFCGEQRKILQVNGAILGAETNHKGLLITTDIFP